MGILLRFDDPERGSRTGIQVANTIYDVTDKYPSITGWLRSSVGRAQAAIDELETVARNTKLAYLASVLDAPAIPNLASLASPIENQEVWGADMTYPSQRAARENEAKIGGTLYSAVYESTRPMLMFRGYGSQIIGPYGQLGIRKDSVNSVAEPGLALLLNPALEVVGYGIGIGMRARDIMSENPLYMQQATLYSHSTAVGPGFLLQRMRDIPEVEMRMVVVRDGHKVFESEINTATAQRELAILTEFLGRGRTFPDGVVLLISSAIVLPNDFSLRMNDRLRVIVAGVGTLTNPLMLV